MQIKERGSKVVFLRFEYDPDKKRTVNKSAGTQDKYLDSLSDEVAAGMTEAEREEAQAWLDARKHEQCVRTSKRSITSLPRSMTEAIKALNDPHAMEQLKDADFDAIYRAWAELADAMRNAGHKRPRSKSVK